MELLSHLGANWSHLTQCLSHNGLDPVLLAHMPQWDCDIPYRCHVMCWMLRAIGARYLGVQPEMLQGPPSGIAESFEHQVECISAVAIALRYCENPEMAYNMITCQTQEDRARLVNYVCHMALVLDNTRITRERGVSMQQSRALDDVFLEGVLSSHMISLGPYPMGLKPSEAFSTDPVDELCRVKVELEGIVEERKEALQRMKTAAGIPLETATSTTATLLEDLSGRYQWLAQFDSELGGAVANLNELIDHVSHIILPMLHSSHKTQPPQRSALVPTLEKVSELSFLIETAQHCLRESCDVYVALQEGVKVTGEEDSTNRRVKEISLAVSKLSQLLVALPSAVRTI